MGASGFLQRDARHSGEAESSGVEPQAGTELPGDAGGVGTSGLPDVQPGSPLLFQFSERKSLAREGFRENLPLSASPRRKDKSGTGNRERGRGSPSRTGAPALGTASLRFVARPRALGGASVGPPFLLQRLRLRPGRPSFLPLRGLLPPLLDRNLSSYSHRFCCASLCSLPTLPPFTHFLTSFSFFSWRFLLFS